MPDDGRASVIIQHLLDGLANVLPAEQQGALAGFIAEARDRKATDAAEWHRAFACADWAARVVSLPERNHLAGRARRALEVVKEATQAVRSQYENLLQVPVGQQTSPSYEVEITWVYEAIHVAEDVAAEVGWDAVPWQELVRDVLAVPTE